MSTLITTTSTSPTTIGKGSVRTTHIAKPQLLKCVILTLHRATGDFLQAIAEQESWNAVICSDEKMLAQCLFQEKIQFAIVVLPNISNTAYEQFRRHTEWISGQGSFHGISASGVGGILLAVCSSGEIVQEEIWARQLGVWSYLPIVPVKKQPRPDETPSNEGLSILFSEARGACEKITLRPQ